MNLLRNCSACTSGGGSGGVSFGGGNSGVSNGATGRGGIKSLPFAPNPANARVATPLMADLLARGKAGGYPADIKMVYSVGGDLFNQAPNVAKSMAAAQQLEFMVVHDHFVTPTRPVAPLLTPVLPPAIPMLPVIAASA